MSNKITAGASFILASLGRLLRLALLLLGLMQPGIVAASHASGNDCRMQSQLAILHLHSKQFLAGLRSGEASEPARRLSTWLKNNPKVSLQLDMRRAGLRDYEDLTLSIVTIQMVLLRTYERKGAENAIESAQHLQIETYLDLFGDRILPLPCANFDAQDRYQAHGEGQAGGKREVPATVVASISMSVLLLLAGILFAIDRIAKRNQRQSKRYPCSVPCKVIVGKKECYANIVDISLIGATVKIDDSLNIAGDVGIALPDGNVSAKVVWNVGCYLGVNFKNHLHASQVGNLRKMSGSMA